MGKRILSQRRGKGGIQHRAPIKGKISDARYPSINPNETVLGTIKALVHDRARSSPLAKIRIADGPAFYLPAISGMSVNSTIELGPDAEVRSGNVLPLGKIPEGSSICNIELSYGDGGRLIRASGGTGTLFAHGERGTVIRLPSRKSIIVDEACRASVGRISGGGRLDRPLLRAGKHFHIMQARGKRFPSVRGVAMASVHHPFGGGRHQHPGKSTTVSRDAPPGRKVGSIAARKTGRKKIGRRLQ